MPTSRLSCRPIASLLTGILAVALAGCGGGSSSPPPGGAAGTTGTGGGAELGGHGGGAGQGSLAGAAGTTGTGGSAGATATGGAGGATGTGGAAGTPGTGGSAGTTGTGGAAGTTGTGGAGTGGNAGATGMGGAAGAAGTPGTGGAAGAAGTPGTGGAAGATGGSGGGTCTSGARSCGQNNDVDVCNSSGTSLLYVQSCANGCGAGLCTGACTPGAKRCNRSGTSDVLEQCDSTGTTWQVAQTCASYCDARNVTCATAATDITADTTLDGVVVVNGAFVVHAGATVTSPTGNLTIYATQIIVESGASIVVAPTGQTAAGQGPSATQSSLCAGRGLGGGYGAQGDYGGSGCTGTVGGPIWGSSTDSVVSAGSPGGYGVMTSSCTTGAPGLGGGVLRLIASSSINVAGQISANGAQGGSSSCPTWYGSGGGSGGGILLAADALTVTGTLSASGGSGGPQSGGAPGGTGGLGRVKLLYGSSHGVTGTVTGTRTDGLLPPLTVTSTTHPNPTLIYNDAFAQATFSWSQPFPSHQGYYYRFDTTAATVPSPATGTFLATETLSIPRSGFAAGANYLHLVSIDATSNVGAVQTSFEVVLNTTPPTVSSTSHPSQTTWVNNPAPFFSWTLPVADASLKGVYYVFDQFANTVPTSADTFLPIAQKQLLLSNVTNGVWVFHVVSRDTRDVLTTQAGHYQVRIGTDPGSGTISGQVVDGSAQPVSGATVTVNRGIFTQTSSSTGNYSFTTVPAGSWEVEVTKTGSASTATKTVTVTASTATTANLVLN